jgi:hypothetical protein
MCLDLLKKVKNMNFKDKFFVQKTEESLASP